MNAVIRTYYIYKALRNLSNGTKKDDIINNYQIFQSCIGEFESINASLATFECMLHDYFSLDFAIFNTSEYNPRNQLNLLCYFSSDSFLDIFGQEYLPLLYRIICYELITRVNSIYLITVTQIVKHSTFIEDPIKRLADEMYSYLLSMLQNARVISVQTNYLFPTCAENIEHRGKENNTTRLQILYGYENYDAYFLRLDLAHKGQGFVHYNNKSPGGIKSCFFTEKEYESCVLRFPESRRFFIQYGNRYALKELIHLKLTNEEASIFEELRKTKEHVESFTTDYSEKNVVDFINTISAMLPQVCVVGIDVEEEHARYCFNYDKIMFNVVLLDLAILSRNDAEIKNGIDRIVSLAQNYGLITKEMTDSFNCLEGVSLIINEAKNRIPLYRDIL